MVNLTEFAKISALWAVVLMVAGCAGVSPYDPPAHGEPPPTRGLFSGEDGEFVIYVDLDDTGAVNVEKEQEEGADDKKP